MDFTLIICRSLLESLVAQGYTFQPYAEFLENPAPRSIILRHDVEALYGNALAFAKIQHELGVRGTYYFRFLPRHFDKEIIRQIAALGHETGYHYDDLSHCKGNYEKAIRRFEANLATLREIAPVKTICMEGAPLSRWDNRDLWGKHQNSSASWRTEFQTTSKNQIQNSQNTEHATRNTEPIDTAHPSPLTVHYKNYGIIGEPYFDTDFSRVLYLTDTGRRWDGEKVSVRDKVDNLPHPLAPSPRSPLSRGTGGKGGQGVKGVRLHSTADIIAAANAGLLPDQVMFTFHPQRWTDKPLPWLRELVMQNVKNAGKRLLLLARGAGRGA